MGVGAADFRILGPLEIWVEESELRLQGTKRPIVLSCLLLAEGKPVSLGRLIDAVWGPSVPVTAEKQIRNAVSDLRRALSGVSCSITPVVDGYRLDIGQGTLDATSFAQRVASARRHWAEDRLELAATELRAALYLWRGPALDGLDSAALQAQVVRLDEQRLSVMEEYVDLELNEGKYQSLVSELSGWVADNPLRERLVSQLMLSLWHSGAQARALAVYEQTQRTLEAELGVKPGLELRETYDRIVTNDVGPGSPTLPGRRGNLPGDIVHFTGRGSEIRQLVGALGEAGGSRPSPPAVVAIDGMAGVGKTALAVRVAHQLIEAYPDAQLVVDMQAHSPGCAPLEPAAALGALLRAMGTPDDKVPAGLEGLRAAWRHQVADRRVLVLLDNVVDTPQIRPLLLGVAGCVTLVTSRWRLTGLDYSYQMSLNEMSKEEAGELFRRVVGDGRPAAEPDAASTVLWQCGHLPKAIRIAATRLRHRSTWTVSHLASRLAHEGRRLAELGTDDGGVIETFNSSYLRLSADQQQLFRTLGCLSGSDVDIRSVAVLVGSSLDQVEYRLEQLVDAHLLQEAPGGGYQTNELLRAYAVQLAMEAGRNTGGSDGPDGGPVVGSSVRLAERQVPSHQPVSGR